MSKICVFVISEWQDCRNAIWVFFCPGVRIMRMQYACWRCLSGRIVEVQYVSVMSEWQGCISALCLLAMLKGQGCRVQYVSLWCPRGRIVGMQDVSVRFVWEAEFRSAMRLWCLGDIIVGMRYVFVGDSEGRVQCASLWCLSGRIVEVQDVSICGVWVAKAYDCKMRLLVEILVLESVVLFHWDLGNFNEILDKYFLTNIISWRTDIIRLHINPTTTNHRD